MASKGNAFIVPQNIHLRHKRQPSTWRPPPPPIKLLHMPLSWNEIKSNALQFSKTWADAASEDSQAKPFWIDFFEIFGVNNKRVATFEHAT
jgi:hypothetical protein